MPMPIPKPKNRRLTARSSEIWLYPISRINEKENTKLTRVIKPKNRANGLFTLWLIVIKGPKRYIIDFQHIPFWQFSHIGNNKDANGNPRRINHKEWGAKLRRRLKYWPLASQANRVRLRSRLVRKWTRLWWRHFIRSQRFNGILDCADRHEKNRPYRNFLAV